MNSRTPVVLFFSILLGLIPGLCGALDSPANATFEEAKSLLREAYDRIDADPEAARKSCEAALARLGDVSEAVRKQAEFHIVKGHLLDLLDKPEESLEAFARAEKLDPEDVRPVQKQGDVHLFRDRPEAALPFFERAAEMAPEDTSIHGSLAHTLDSLGRFAEAEKAYRKILDLDPENDRARRNHAGVLAELDRDEEALPIWQAFVDADADDLVALWNLAQTFQLLGKHEDAEREFLAYRRKDPTYWRALEKLCQVSEALGKTGERDRFVKELYGLRESPDAPEDLVEKVLFVRDQFTIGDLKVYGIEYFELKGERALKYSFTARREIPGEESKFVNKISLGSYESTNEVSRRTGDIGNDERLYHLDMYPPDGSHYTLGFFKNNPGYDKAKELAIRGFKDELEPISGTIPNPPEDPGGDR